MTTAVPLALAREKLTQDDEPFFMLNSDVICDFPLNDMLNFHRSHGAEGTILVTEVQDPTKYGVVVSEHKTGKIISFVEKPQVYVSNKINAGIYLFNVNILKRIQLKPTSIEREIFPHMSAESQIYAMPLQGYWMDVGQPKDYITGTSLHLGYMRKTHPEKLIANEASQIYIGNVLIDSTATIGNNVCIGPDVVIGKNCVIEDGVRIKYSTLMDDTHVKKHAHINKCIIGWQGKIGQWSRVNNSVLGKDVTVANEIYINEATVCPHKGKYQ
jgi:mannose-1-phosphate guanylyltransferase